MNLTGINFNNKIPCKTPCFYGSKNSLNFRGKALSYDSFEPRKKLFNKDENGDWTAVLPLGRDNSYTLIYDEDVVSDDENKLPYPPVSIKFKKPVNCNKAFEVFRKYIYGCGFCFLDDDEQLGILKDFLNNSDFKDEKISSLIYAVEKTIVLELQNGHVLKMTDYNPFEKRPFEPEFDMPLMSDVYKCKDYYIYMQEKKDSSPVSKDDLNDVTDRIYKAGYKPYDMHECQIGFSPSLKKPMLLDSECAQRIED